MSKRNLILRQQQIIHTLNTAGKVTVEQLSKQFKTSQVTIRKDLALLETDGLLMRRYGGAVSIKQSLSTYNQPFISERKKRIAIVASQYVKDNQRIIIDSGKTTSAIIPFLAEKQGLVIMTNSLTNAEQINTLSNEPMLLMTGGTWDPHSEAFQGQVAEQVLRAYDFDQLFIGADGIDIERGTTTFNELLSVSQVMADVAREVIVLVDSDKIGRKMPNLELPWQTINILITDNNLSASYKEQLEQQGVNVIYA